jgi:hypothetical protein
MIKSSRLPPTLARRPGNLDRVTEIDRAREAFRNAGEAPANQPLAAAGLLAAAILTAALMFYLTIAAGRPDAKEDAPAKEVATERHSTRDIHNVGRFGP